MTATRNTIVELTTQTLGEHASSHDIDAIVDELGSHYSYRWDDLVISFKTGDDVNYFWALVEDNRYISEEEAAEYGVKLAKEIKHKEQEAAGLVAESTKQTLTFNPDSDSDDLDFPLSELLHALYINHLHKVNNTKSRNGYFPLKDLYRLLVEVDGQRPMPIKHFHRALLELVDSRKFDLVPEENQKVLTNEDRQLAVWCGGSWKHFLVKRDN